jgi:hypothetical protein
VIRSGRKMTYSPGKDTGRYWDAGAANVHWLIATDDQVADGVWEAVGRVRTDGVFIEGNSFTEYIQPDFLIMVARSKDIKIKATARKALSRVSAFYLSDETGEEGRQRLKETLAKLNLGDFEQTAPVFTPSELPGMVAHLRELYSRVAA